MYTNFGAFIKVTNFFAYLLHYYSVCWNATAFGSLYKGGLLVSALYSAMM